jgi:hypothetical protein
MIRAIIFAVLNRGITRSFELRCYFFAAFFFVAFFFAAFFLGPPPLSDPIFIFLSVENVLVRIFSTLGIDLGSVLNFLQCI